MKFYSHFADLSEVAVVVVLKGVGNYRVILW